jgi:hypothetical protein
MNISEIEFYESINELPYGNYIEFQQLLAIEAEQGSDGGDLKKNLYSAIALINDDAKEEAVQKIVNTITKKVQRIKKKITRELRLFFPNWFEYDSELIEALKFKALRLCEQYGHGKDREKAIKQAQQRIIKLTKPKDFNGHSSVLSN